MKTVLVFLLLTTAQHICVNVTNNELRNIIITCQVESVIAHWINTCVKYCYVTVSES